MDIKHMKNIVVLKNIPSNMVEEAFVILKDNVKIHNNKSLINNKNLKETEKNEKTEKERNKKNSKEYVIKEAEMIVNDYISKIEENSIKGTSEKIKLQEKCRRLKYSNIFFILFSIFAVISIIIR